MALGCWRRWGVLCLAASGCIVDSDHPCGPHQEELTQFLEGCVCAEGAVPNADGVGCHPCGDNEQAVSGSCVCAEGFARAGASAPCLPASDAGGGEAGAPSAPTGQDMACASQDDCAGYDASYCETLQGKICLVPGCATGESVCASDRECCDLSQVPIPELAATGGLCVPVGTCTSPGMVVTP